MAKVLIATLGTGRIEEATGQAERSYRLARYRMEGSNKEYKTPFVAAALMEELRIDKIILIGTRKSIWEDVYGYFTEKNNAKVDEDYWLDLVEKTTSEDRTKLITGDGFLKTEEALDNYIKYLRQDASGGSRCITIEYGLNTAELWRNFGVFMEIEKLLESGDEVYLDITHAFRSIPIFMYLMMDFIDTLQSGKIKLSGIYYGMLDIIREMGHAPIVDLGPLFTISKWIRATHSFVNYGNGFLMADLIKNTQLQKTIRNISEQVSINYLVDLRKEIKDLSKKIGALGDANTEEVVFAYMLPTLKEFIARFENISVDSNFQLAMAKWYFDNKNYASGYICMAESIITRLCEIYGLKITKQYNRNLIKSLTWTSNNPFKGRDEDLDKLLDTYNDINPIRNKVAHASFDTETKDQDKNTKLDQKLDINNVNNYYTKLNKILNSEALKDLPKTIPLEEIKKAKER